MTITPAQVPLLELVRVALAGMPFRSDAVNVIPPEIAYDACGGVMTPRLGCLLLVVSGCATASTPLSVDVRYNADAAKLQNAEALAGARIAVGRFRDSRPRRAGDMHAASYVGHDGSYDVGLTWRGRTFTAVPEVVQGLMVEELEHAGLSVEAVDATIRPGDSEAARAAGEKAHGDVVLGGEIHELIFKAPDAAHPSVRIDVQLFEGLTGKPLAKFTIAGSQNGDGDERPQQRVDELLERSFKPASHRLVERLSQEVTNLMAAAVKENEAAAAH